MVKCKPYLKALLSLCLAEIEHCKLSAIYIEDRRRGNLRCVAVIVTFEQVHAPFV